MKKHELNGDSAELVAYQLLLDVQDLEGRVREGGGLYDRQQYLDLYAECLNAVQGSRNIRSLYFKP